MMLSDLWTSVVRTVVPGAVGAVLGWLATWWAAPPPELETAIQAVVTFVLMAAYYLLAREMEKRGIRWAGYLLGRPSPPVYGQVPEVDSPTIELAQAIEAAGHDASTVIAMLESSATDPPAGDPS